MAARRERLIVAILIAIFLLALSLPYLVAWRAADSQHVFGGFLTNYLDGNSYLAKMREGFNSAWLFTLPYTAQPGAGAAINLYYLFLGHLASWFGLSQIFVFHTARLLGALLLAIVLYRFFSAFFSKTSVRLWAFAIALFGSGLGWLALAAGLGTTMDYWVAEAYPFLASFTNAHFPLGLALQIFLLTPIAKFDIRSAALTAVAALLLSIIYPFGWLVAVSVLGVWVLWQFLAKVSFRTDLFRFICMALAGLPFSIYSLWIVNVHPILAGWSAQNLTPAPALWDFVMGFSPALIFAIFGIWFSLRTKKANTSLLITWLVVGIVLVYFPGDLQRRFISGLFVPVVALCFLSIERLARDLLTVRVAALLLLLFSLPTNIFLLSASMQAAKQNDSALYLQTSEIHAYAWLDEHAAGTLVLASPSSGLYIPAYSRARVLYGHPFETVNAVAHRTEVESFFAGPVDAASFLVSNHVDFVFYGPREQALGPLPSLLGWQSVYSNEGVEIWAPRQ